MLGLTAFLAFCAAAGISPVHAAPPPYDAPTLLASDLVQGAWWGKGMSELPPSLSAGGAAGSGRLAPTDFLEATLVRLWAIPEGSRAGFDSISVASGSWVLTHGGRAVGYLQKVDIDDWDFYEQAARSRFGEPRRIHFSVDAATAPADTPRYMHLYSWQDGVSRFLIIKRAPRSDTQRWRERRSGAEMRLRVLDKVGDGSIPLYVAVLSVREGARPRGRKGPPLDVSHPIH